MLCNISESLIRCRYLALAISNDINAIDQIFKTEFSCNLESLYILGPTVSKVLLVSICRQWYLISFNKPLAYALPSELDKYIIVNAQIDAYIYHVSISAEFIETVCTPTIKLVALCHPEIFPLPRFPLGISCLAETIRGSYEGLVSLGDMQVGDTLSTILSDINKNRYDIIGISVSFGQKDLLDDLLNKIYDIPNYEKIVVVGGTLSALIYGDILKVFSQLIVCLGSGEETVLDIIKYWRKEISIDDISYIAYKEQSGQINITDKTNRRSGILKTPALDLIDRIFRCGGAMQLETSRGCTNSCTFCPRSHKGDWQSINASDIISILPHIVSSYERNTHIKRCVYLVDEEWLGHDDKSNIERVVDLARAFNAHGLDYETSCRISQAWDLTKTVRWHIERARLWKFFVQNNLRRVLLGIESGVDTVLARFGKGTKVKQNIYGVRLLTALNVPLRLTYITFDPLMTKDELINSFKFQGKTDILLSPVEDLTEKELIHYISDEHFAKTYSRNIPMYYVIPYMLVSLECLNGTKYLAKAKSILGNGRDIVTMGKSDIPYADKEIGRISYFCQLWIDRNFPFEYTLKSLQKICSDEANSQLNEIRVITKVHSYELLSRLIYLITSNDTVLIPSITSSDASNLNLANCLLTKVNFENDLFDSILTDLLNYQFKLLHSEVVRSVESTMTFLEQPIRIKLAKAVEAWKENSRWQMINQ